MQFSWYKDSTRARNSKPHCQRAFSANGVPGFAYQVVYICSCAMVEGARSNPTKLRNTGCEVIRSVVLLSTCIRVLASRKGCNRGARCSFDVWATESERNRGHPRVGTNQVITMLERCRMACSICRISRANIRFHVGPSPTL